MTRMAAGIALLVFGCPTQAADTISVLTLNGKTILARSAVRNGEVSAGLCVQYTSSEETTCYYASNDSINYRENARLTVATAGLGATLFLFTARAAPDFSRQKQLLSVLAVDSRFRLRLLVRPVVHSEQSEFRAWENRSISLWPVLTTADYEFAEGETHFGDHKYELNTFVYARHCECLEKMDTYSISRKYPGYDDVDKIDVISHELPTLRRRLREAVKRIR